MISNIQHLKLSVFAKYYWQDEEFRLCRDTMVSHIKHDCTDEIERQTAMAVKYQLSMGAEK